jgi:hypothetical protein
VILKRYQDSENGAETQREVTARFDAADSPCAAKTQQLSLSDPVVSRENLPNAQHCLM